MKEKDYARNDINQTPKRPDNAEMEADQRRVQKSPGVQGCPPHSAHLVPPNYTQNIALNNPPGTSKKSTLTELKTRLCHFNLTHVFSGKCFQPLLWGC